ncbi:hypothetical protein PR202_ga28497 [Eleusine coracana subsp. coracana]|uniref:F-box domain-containing protein n=1 Tax=Eleusine coracana subsp. coracana TaxID=191504 RepID=A0AAV5DJX1_ELECO|nr:hypothetical protein PR202_ga28497 [Eleusine coracana subsp. coracana]
MPRTNLRIYVSVTSLLLIGLRLFIVGDDIYFVLRPSDIILIYDIGKNCLSSIDPSTAHDTNGGIALMPMEDGSLGLTNVRGPMPFLWSRYVDPVGIAGWVQLKVIELEQPIAITPFFGEDEVEVNVRVYWDIPRYAPPRPPPELIDDAVSEILLRIPPEEPAYLFRAALVCKHWRRILSDPSFLRRYRSFNQTPPMLGFFCNVFATVYADPCFVPTTAASPVPQTASSCHPMWALDCRHGRVLLRQSGSDNLTVWDPITGDREELHWPDFPFSPCAAVFLCAAAGCDHYNCHGTPFLVVVVGRNGRNSTAYACVYTSEGGTWGTPISVHFQPTFFTNRIAHGTHIRDEFYFVLELGARILKYDLGRNYLSVINTPDVYHDFALMSPDWGLLGLVDIIGFRLYLWLRKAIVEGKEGWEQCRVIDLEKLIPTRKLSRQPEVIGTTRKQACSGG